MAMYFPGYDVARAKVYLMDELALRKLMGDLFGVGNLPENPTLDDLRAEALEQLKREFTDTSSPEYERLQFYLKWTLTETKQ